jgi:hypothetical protein
MPEISISALATALALAWGSGLRLYLVLFLCGLAGRMGWVELPEGLSLLEHPVVLGASGFMVLVEFFADKIPWLDSLWDAVHTFIRIPAGAALAAIVLGESGPAMALAAAILGGTVAAGSHFTKAGARSLINTSPEPFSNWGASLSEDALVPAGLWLAIANPWLFLALLVLAAVAALFMVRWTIRGARALLRRFQSRTEDVSSTPESRARP